MFIQAVPDNRGKKDGYYCSLVESRRVDGIPRHEIVLSFGFIAAERLPYLKAAFNRGDPKPSLRVKNVVKKSERSLYDLGKTSR